MLRHVRLISFRDSAQDISESSKSLECANCSGAIAAGDLKACYRQPFPSRQYRIVEPDRLIADGRRTGEVLRQLSGCARCWFQRRPMRRSTDKRQRPSASAALGSLHMTRAAASSARCRRAGARSRGGCTGRPQRYRRLKRRCRQRQRPPKRQSGKARSH